MFITDLKAPEKSGAFIYHSKKLILKFFIFNFNKLFVNYLHNKRLNQNNQV